MLPLLYLPTLPCSRDGRGYKIAGGVPTDTCNHYGSDAVIVHLVFSLCEATLPLLYLPTLPCSHDGRGYKIAGGVPTDTCNHYGSDAVIVHLVFSFCRLCSQ